MPELANLSVWDERDDFALAVAGLISITSWTTITRATIGELSLVVSLERRSDLRSIIRIHGDKAPRRTLALHEVFAAHRTGRFDTCRGPHARRWKLRALVELGFCEPVTVELPELIDAPDTVTRVWNAIAALLSIRWIEEPPGSPCPLSSPWVAAWTGIREGEIRTAKRWLERHGHITRAGTAPGRFGKDTILWEVVRHRDENPRPSSETNPENRIATGLALVEEAVSSLYRAADDAEAMGAAILSAKLRQTAFAFDYSQLAKTLRRTYPTKEPRVHGGAR